MSANKTFSLNRKGLNLANVKIDVTSGNPYRNSATGKFGFEIPGVAVIMGKRFLRAIDTESRNSLANRVKYTGARQMGIKQNETGTLTVVLATEGRILDTFTLPPPLPLREDETAHITATGGEKGQPYEAALDFEEEELRDQILNAARDLNLRESQIESAIEEKLGRDLSEAEKEQLQQEIDRQRLEDLVQYLSYNMHRFYNKGEEGGRVKIRTPRGYLRRTFSGLDKTQAQKVVSRLQGLGWNEEQLEAKVFKYMPKRLRREFGRQEDEDK